MVTPFVKPSPVIANQVEIEVVGCHLRLPIQQLLETPIAQHEGSSA